MAFRKAERKKSFLKIGISGTSGSGKTYSALKIAHGIAGDWEKVALIDTENGSGDLYSSLGGYSVCTIDPPFTPEKYINAINEAVACGFTCIIIDSLSHAWNGAGGMLEIQGNKAAKSGNSYTAWRDVTPMHNKLVDTILQAKADVICTLRAKTEYVVEQNEKGKSAPRKVGLAPIFRDGLEYEMTVFFDISIESHTASATKDRTGLFDNQFFTPSEDTGETLNAWRASGAAEKEYHCTNCGGLINDVRMKDGSMLKAADFDERFGHLCPACIRKAAEEKKAIAEKEAAEKEKPAENPEEKQTKNEPKQEDKKP